ncbi:MAG: MFS transporter [Phycisphaerae bacterium]|nr:MFS transporter [Phycisphaerae bacterium]
MRPAWALGGLLGSIVSGFHPKRLPPMLRATYARELVSWLFLPVMLGAIEGGTISIVVKKSFTGAADVSDWTLNIAVTILTAAPNFANLTSFVWAALARGRAKVPFISALQVATALLVAAMALAPHDLFGLVLITTLAVIARTCWTGVITLRTAVWRNNYPHASRANIAGKMAVVQSLMLAIAGWIVGEWLDWNPNLFHVLFPLLAAYGLLGNSIYRQVRLRGQRRLARAELAGRAGPAFSLAPWSMARALGRSMREVGQTLADDALYRRFMWWMFVFGFGNLMFSAPLALVLADEFRVDYHAGIMVTTVIPLVVMPFAIPLWAKLMGRTHIIEFRAIHGWSFVAGSVAMWLASMCHAFWLFYVSSVLLGIGFGGGILAWNLGHHDFAPAHKDGQYMAVHVTLNGIRGLLAPIASLALYEWFKRLEMVWLVFLVCVIVNTVGVLGFMAMRRSLRRSDAERELQPEPPLEPRPAIAAHDDRE